MQFLTREECETWRATRAPCANVTRNRGRGPLAVAMPGDLADVKARRLIPLSRGLVEWLLAKDPAARMLHWVTEYGIWASSEDLNQYGAWRRAHGNNEGSAGNNEGLDLSPGHAIAPENRGDAVSLVAMSLVFGWGFVALLEGSDRTVLADHDGHLWVTSESEDALHSAERLFARLHDHA